MLLLTVCPEVMFLQGYNLDRSWVTITGVEHRPSSATATKPIVKEPARGSPVTKAFVR